jgi:hypothetical protein
MSYAGIGQEDLESAGHIGQDGIGLAGPISPSRSIPNKSLETFGAMLSY